MHKAVLALCQEFTTQLLCSQDPNNWGMALRIKRKYFHALSVRIERMGYKINNMAKERNNYYFLHITPDEERETVTIKHKITSDFILDLYEEASLLKGSAKRKLMIKVKLLSQYIGGYMVQ
jgi:hypothetical protein|tara:strand:- start:55 stop:417 length:363 start_codon:yes stop_codon:yes gene_type:complete